MVVTLFFFSNLFVFFPEKTTRDEGLFETTTSGQKGQTRGSVLTSVVDVREETKEEARCFLMTSDD